MCGNDLGYTYDLFKDGLKNFRGFYDSFSIYQYLILDVHPHVFC